MSNRNRAAHFHHAKIAIMASSLVLMTFEGNASQVNASKGGITEIRITSIQPAFGGASFGSVGAYEILTGRAFGTIDPQAPANAGLTNLNLAPRNPDGLIGYSMDIAILRPVNAAAGNGRIFYEIVNRGAPQSFNILNKGSLSTPGNGFLMRQGYEIVLSGWQPEANPATAI